MSTNFLDLPAEIRLLIYEAVVQSYEGRPRLSLYNFLYLPSHPLLQTCQQITAEVRPYFNRYSQMPVELNLSGSGCGEHPDWSLGLDLFPRLPQKLDLTFCMCHCQVALEAFDRIMAKARKQVQTRPTETLRDLKVTLVQCARSWAVRPTERQDLIRVLEFDLHCAETECLKGSGLRSLQVSLLEEKSPTADADVLPPHVQEACHSLQEYANRVLREALTLDVKRDDVAERHRHVDE